MAFHTPFFVFIFVFVLWMSSIGLSISLVNGECSCYASDRQALLDFKSQIMSDYSGRLATWKGQCCCTWPGVACRGGRVVSLNLSLASAGDESDYGIHSKMYGSLSPSVGKLSMLEILDLSEVQYLSGHIPETLSALANLRSLLLSKNNFTGPIPSSLSALHNLQFLDLSVNGFEGPFPPWIGALSNLRLLQLSYNDLLTGPLPSSLTSLSKLEKLDLNGLFETSYATLPSDLSNLRSLTSLTIIDSVHLIGLIPSLLPINLKTLRISNTGITGSIPSSLGLRLSNLEELELSANYNLQGRIPSSLGRLSNLKKLDLSLNTRLEGPIPDSFGSLSRLTTLSIASCSITGPLPQSIGGMSSLTDLNLRYNRIDGTIPDSIGQLSQLYNMVIDHNRLSGHIPNGFAHNLRSLRSLSLDYNKLTGLPSDLSRLRNLEQVYLDNNKGLDPNALSGLATLPSLTMMSIRSCGMSGPLPTWLTTMQSQQVTTVDLSHNLFSGPIPMNLDRLGLSEKLLLAGNRLSGSIPPTLGNMTELWSLDLSMNKLSGRIPWELSKFTRMFSFNVSSNRLIGEIPQIAPFTSFGMDSYLGNPGLCGHPLPPCSNGKS